MKFALFAFFVASFGLFFSSCESKSPDDYQNKAVQTVNVGDEVYIYYTTNSCCAYCSPNKNELAHLEYVGEKSIIPSPSDCDGCGETNALVFKAKSGGTDTIRGCVHEQSVDCSDTLADMETFVVHVR